MTAAAWMRHLGFLLFALLYTLTGVAQDNPLKKAARGDWAKYLVTSKNQTIPLMSSKDAPKWRVVSNVGEGFVRIDNYIMFGNRRSGAGGSIEYFKDPFEPVQGIQRTAKVEIVSTTKEQLSINGKQYSCTKIVRKIHRPMDDAKAQSSWIGTSTIWVCSEVPLGLARMENAYEMQLGKSDKPSRMIDTWVIAESGFKNWSD